jgi:hypothetical protein
MRFELMTPALTYHYSFHYHQGLRIGLAPISPGKIQGFISQSFLNIMFVVWNIP